MYGYSLPGLLVSTSSGSAAALTFVQSANLIMNFDPSTLTGVDGAGQATWTDSESGFVASVTGGGQPTLKTNVMNGKPALRCAGSQWMDMGRPAAFTAALASDYTIMMVCTNLVAGANALAGMFGGGLTTLWMVANTTNIGRFADTAYRTNPLAAGDLYVIFYSGRGNSTPGTFKRSLAGVNGTCFMNSPSTPEGAGSGNFGIGSTRIDSTVNGNTYSFRGDILGLYAWDTNLAYVDIIRQTRLVYEFYDQPMPWAGVTNRFWIADGDSITLGVGGGYGAAQNYPSIAATSMSKVFGQWTNNGRNGASATTLAADYAFQYTGIMGADALGTGCLFTFFEFTNERSLDSVFTGTNSWATQSKALNPSAMTSIINSVAVGGTTGDQVSLGGANSTNGTRRLLYASTYYPSATNWDICIDTASNASIGVIGSNPYSGAKPAEWSDDLHPTAAGYVILAGIVTPAISASL
jgi:hypothetical protein